MIMEHDVVRFGWWLGMRVGMGMGIKEGVGLSDDYGK
jgi:hypothetical protein